MQAERQRVQQSHSWKTIQQQIMYEGKPEDNHIAANTNRNYSLYVVYSLCVSKQVSTSQLICSVFHKSGRSPHLCCLGEPSKPTFVLRTPPTHTHFIFIMSYILRIPNILCSSSHILKHTSLSAILNVWPWKAKSIHWATNWRAHKSFVLKSPLTKPDKALRVTENQTSIRALPQCNLCA